MESLLEHEGIVDVLQKWGKYEEGGHVNVGGKPYQIVYVMAHHESGCAWLVLKQKYEREMWEYDINYEQGIPK